MFFGAPFFSRIYCDSGSIFLMQNFPPVWHVKSPAAKLEAEALRFIGNAMLGGILSS